MFADEVFAELALINTLIAMEIPFQGIGQILEPRPPDCCTCNSLQVIIHAKAGGL
jgi:hypothetical protein